MSSWRRSSLSEDASGLGISDFALHGGVESVPCIDVSTASGVERESSKDRHRFGDDEHGCWIFGIAISFSS